MFVCLYYKYGMRQCLYLFLLPYFSLFQIIRYCVLMIFILLYPFSLYFTYTHMQMHTWRAGLIAERKAETIALISTLFGKGVPSITPHHSPSPQLPSKSWQSPMLPVRSVTVASSQREITDTILHKSTTQVWSPGYSKVKFMTTFI